MVLNGMKDSSSKRRENLLGKIIFACVLSSVTQTSFSGAYILDRNSNGELNTGVSTNTVVHPIGYSLGADGVTDAVNGELRISVCIDNSSSNKSNMVTSVKNIINTYNALAITTANLNPSNVSSTPASNEFDFESTALHELGHCLGLGHPNLGNAPGVSSALGFDFSNSLKEFNTNDYVFDSGLDGVPGSKDDIRGNSINLVWFAISTNNPFEVVTPFDMTNYSNDIANLPDGHNYAAIASREVYGTPDIMDGVNDTEAVMIQGAEPGEIQRSFAADDVIMLRYAMSGLDEVQGTGDDYTYWLEYDNTNTNCNINLTMQSGQTNLASSVVPTVKFINSDHRKVSKEIGTNNVPTVTFNGSANWYFNNVANTDGNPDQFNLAVITNVQPNAVVASTSFTVSGINVEVPISVAGAIDSEYSIARVNNGVFTAANGVARNGDIVTVRHTAAGELNTTTTTTLNIGGVSGGFTSTTVTDPASNGGNGGSAGSDDGGGGALSAKVLLFLLILSLIVKHSRYIFPKRFKTKNC